MYFDFESFEVSRHLKTKAKVEISLVTFKRWSPNSNYPKYAVMKKFLLTPNKGPHEVQIMQQVNKLHPWTVKYYSSGTDNDGFFYILMEYCAKQDLRKFIRRNKSLNQNPPIEVLIRYFFILTDLVMVLHQNKIWHRDIKPENIFVHENEELRLGDWGVSKSYINAVNKEKYHTLTGTQPYMSPELAERKNHNKLSVSFPDSDDIWALGQTFFEMCTLERVNITSDIQFTINREMNRRNYDEKFTQLIVGMLNPDMLTRWKIKDVWDHLMNFVITLNIRPIYNKNDEDEAYSSENVVRKEITVESETIRIPSLGFSSVKHIGIQKTDSQASISLEPTNVPAISIIESSPATKDLTLGAINQQYTPSLSMEKPTKEPTGTFGTLTAAFEHIVQNAETEAKFADAIVKTVNATKKIFKDIATDLSDDIIIAFFATLYKENEEKIDCRVCKSDSWVKLNPKNWKPYKIRCKHCKSNFCSFCLYGGGHRKCLDYENLFEAIYISTISLKQKNKSI